MTRWRKARAFLRGLTVLFGGRLLTHQHASAHDLFVHKTSSPAARHFIGPLQRIARRTTRRFIDADPRPQSFTLLLGR